MYIITDKQVDFILNDIRARGVTMESLQQDILDHVCCIIEGSLEETADFEAFYRQTITRFYKSELAEIEEETNLLLTFKNYYAMKKVMIATGALSVSMFIVGSVFKVMYWPGASVLLFLGVLLFSLVFLPLLFILKNREMKEGRDKLILAIGVLVGIGYCMGMLFQVMHWPGARVLWLGTLAVAAFILIPLYFFTGIRRPETKVNTIVTSILMVGVLGIHFLMTALRPSTQMQGRAYSYLQSEELLQKLQQRPSVADKEAQAIQLTCSQLKDLILKKSMGMSALPEDFERKHLRINELNLWNQFFAEPQPQQLLQQLADQVNKYNAANTAVPGKQIPIKNSILDENIAGKDFCSNLFVLNNLTQLQLFLANVNTAGTGYTASR